MQAFLGRRYGATVARIVADGAGKEYGIDPAKGGAQVSTGQVLVEGSEGIAGTVVLVVRRQLANMASRIGQRVVGSILSRLVSVVAGGVGLVLIAKDIWDFRHGVLPIVADEMKSKATKDKVREELAKSDRGADRRQPQGDRRQDGRAGGRDLARVPPRPRQGGGARRAAGGLQALPRDGEARRPAASSTRSSALVLAGEGEAGVLKRLDDGTLHRAVTALPPAASRSPARRDRSRRRCNGRRLPATACPRWSSTRCIAAPSPTRSPRPACSACSACRTGSPSRGLPRSRRRPATSLFELRRAELKALARALDETQLDSLSRYLTGLDKASAQRVLRAVAQTPARMAELGKPERARRDPRRAATRRRPSA